MKSLKPLISKLHITVIIIFLTYVNLCNGQITSRNVLSKSPCFGIGDRGPSDDARTPGVKWVNYHEDATLGTISLPWVDRNGAVMTRWYPDPNNGWDVLAYNFGQWHTNRDRYGAPLEDPHEAQVLYILFVHNYTGIMRLFVWIPNPPAGQALNYDKLAANIKIMGVPGTVRPFANTPLPFEIISHQIADWNDHTIFWETNQNDWNSPLQINSWQRAEFASLYVPEFYTEYSNNTPANLGPEVQITFTGSDQASWNGISNGEIKLSGTGVASSNEVGKLSVAKDAVSDIYKGDVGSGAKKAFGFLYGNTLPSFNIELEGSVTGQIEGSSVSFPRSLGDVYFRLWNDNSNLSEALKLRGGNAALQRCKKARWGALYFTAPHGLDPLSLSSSGSRRDPRPLKIPVMVTDEGGPNYHGYIGAYGKTDGDVRFLVKKARMKLGELKLREDLLLDEKVSMTQKITLEIVIDRDIKETGDSGNNYPFNQPCEPNASCYQPEVVLKGEFYKSQSEADYYYLRQEDSWDVPEISWYDFSANYFGVPPFMNAQDEYFSQTGRIKAYVRWKASIFVPGQNIPLNWEYALDVTDKLVFLKCGERNRGCEDISKDW